jgi:lipopolysaccharide heptosyltransferase II
MSTPHSLRHRTADHQLDYSVSGRIDSPWDTAEKVLAVRLDTLGDVLMTTPAIRALKESNPRRHVTLLTSASGASAAALVPEIDDVIVYEAPWMKGSSDSVVGPDRAMIERLRQGNFDASVIFTVYSQNPLPAAMMCYLAEIPLRLAHCHENPYQLLTDWIPDREPGRLIRHETQRQLDLVAAIGCRTADARLSLHVPDSAQHRLFDLLSRIGLDPLQPWAVIHPGATAASRRYPPEQFAQVASQLAGEHEIQVVFTGTVAEQALVDKIRMEMRFAARRAGNPLLPRAYSLAGALRLDEMAALLREAPVLISNNTGPVHMASALGTPVVVLYALTNPQHTPWMTSYRVLSHDDPHDVPCKFCYKSVCVAGHHNCLRLIPPREVVSAALDLLSEHRPERVGLAPTPAVGYVLAVSTKSTSESVEVSA